MNTIKSIIILAASLLTSSLAHAQLRPPVQTDTLIIQSVKYNFADIKPENWPCDVIYKSTTDFKIGDQTFMIESAREDHSSKYHADGVIFKMKDRSELSYYETPENRIIIYSGYEFICEGEGITTQYGTISTRPDSILEGRTVIGNLPRPSYTVQASGVVAVKIWVDTAGNVVKTQFDSEGTTTGNKQLLRAAQQAAMGAHFSQKADAPALQQGTITYTFTLR